MRTLNRKSKDQKQASSRSTVLLALTSLFVVAPMFIATFGSTAASAASYETDGNYDFRRWTTTTRDIFRQNYTGDFHVHVLTDGNHNGFHFTVDGVRKGWNPVKGSWCPPRTTICAAKFTVPAGRYRVGMAKHDTGSKVWHDNNRVNVTAIRVGATGSRR